jgi:pimeloyl-ACP methyl ester carboxylesterase
VDLMGETGFTSGFAEANGLRLAYESIGEGEPLLLIMGFGAQLTHWPDPFCQALAGCGFRVIRFDNRDVGLSSHLDGLRAPPFPVLLARRLAGPRLGRLGPLGRGEVPYTLADMAGDTAGLMDHLGLSRAHVVGASMGGMIGQCLAIAHPHRVMSLVSIMSHPGELQHHLDINPRAVRFLLRAPARSVEEAMDHGEALFRAIGSPGFPFDAAGVRERSRRSYLRAFYPAGVVRQRAAILASPGRSAALAGLRLPATVIHGAADPLIRVTGGIATARAIPGAELAVIEGMGHDLPELLWPKLVELISRTAGRARRA